MSLGYVVPYKSLLDYLAVATNTKPKLMAMGTPERIQALKSTLGMVDDPSG